MLQLGEKETIADIQKRFVRNPKEPLPHTPIDMNTHDQIYNQGWNDAMQYKGVLKLR